MSDITSAFAIRSSNVPDLWVRFNKNHTEFMVINGGWTGKWNADTQQITVTRYPDKLIPATLVWEGEVPYRFGDSRYDAALAWIAKQL